MTPSYPSALMGPPPLRRLKERRAAISTLCSALETFLSLDVDPELEMFERLKTAPALPSVTPEMLATAQIELERMEMQSEAFSKMRDSLPEEFRPMLGAAESLLMPSLDNQRDYVRRLQDQLDGKCFSVLCEGGAVLMNNGTSTRYAMGPTQMFSGTREECAAKAIECGWTMNGDDHTCPECAT